MVQPSAELAIFAVFDGHGKGHGKLAAATAAQVVREFLSEPGRQPAILLDPAEQLREAFALAHGAILEAIEAADPSTRRYAGRSGDFLLKWMDGDEGGHKWDAVDGGTTATVALVLHGRTLVVGAVGDSSAVLIGRAAGGHSGGVKTRLLIDEHAATNAK